MDLSNLVTSENEKEGKWFQVEVYGKKQDFALKLLGNDSDEVIHFQRSQLRNLNMLKKDADELTEVELNEILELSEDAIITKIVGISSIKTKGRFNSEFELIDEPVTIGDVELKNDKKSYKLLLEKVPAIKDFILSKTNDRQNFLA